MEVAVIGFAEAPNERHGETTTNGVEMLVPLIQQLFAEKGLSKSDVGFWCSGSSDYLAGRAFSFVTAVDAIGATPPTAESHVEADAAWAMYEAWVKLLMGEAEIALIYGFGKSSAGNLKRVMALQLDPYLVAPLWPDSVSVAALQARLGLQSGAWSEKEMADVAVRNRAAGLSNANAQISGHSNVEDLLSLPYVADPLRAHDCAPISDGASAILLATGDRARELCERPAWITGFSHYVDSQNLGIRDLTQSVSAAKAAAKAGIDGVEVAEIHAPFTHQEIVLRNAMGLTGGVHVNPSGGALCGNPMFSAGLARIGHAATEIMAGRASKTMGHATSGPALQQNLVCVLEGR